MPSPVSVVSNERSFNTRKIVKNHLHASMKDKKFLEVEKEIADDANFI